ncbi:MAG: hypothetical protein U0744_19140 [Gemmataceae bacterium]
MCSILRYFVTVRRATGVAGFLELRDGIFVRKRVILVFAADNFEQLVFDRFPGDFLTAGGLGSAAEESPGGKMPRGVCTHLSSTATDGRHVDADDVGNLLHLQRFDVLGAFVEKRPLMLDDRLGHVDQGVLPLLHGVEQPLGERIFRFRYSRAFRIRILIAVHLDAGSC